MVSTILVLIKSALQLGRYARLEADSVRFWPESPPATFRFGVPPLGDREFLGDRRAAEAFDAAVSACVRLGGVAVDVPMAPFREAGSFLYEGPLVAERAVVTVPPE